MLEEAREQARQKALSTIWKAREKTGGPPESFLKYSFWQDYRSGSQINVNTETNVAVVKTLTEEERMRLIAQRQSSQDRVNALQDKPKIIEAQVIETDPEHEQPEPEQEQGATRPGPDWAEAREKRKQEAALNEKEEAKEREQERQRAHDRAVMRELFGSNG